MTLETGCPAGKHCPSGERCPCKLKYCVVEYEQPPRAECLKPPTRCPAQASASSWSTEFRDSYPGWCGGRRPPALPHDHLGPLCGPFTSSKVHHEEFPWRAITSRPEQALPRHALRFSTEPLQTDTTAHHDYTPIRCPERAQPLITPDNLRHLGPSQVSTTYSEAFRAPSPSALERLQPLETLPTLRPGSGPLAGRSEYRESYPGWTAPPPRRPPHEFRLPHPAMQGDTTYTVDFVRREAAPPHPFYICGQPYLLGLPQPTPPTSITHEDYSPVRPTSGGHRPPAFYTTDTLKFCGPVDLQSTTSKQFHKLPLQETVQHIPQSAIRQEHKPMQSVTTQRVDFIAKPMERTAPIMQNPGFCSSKVPMEGTTTIRASYGRPEIAPRPSPFYPPARGLGPHRPMEKASLYRDTYKPWTAPAPERWQHPQRKCLPPFDSVTETQERFRPPGHERIVCPPGTVEVCECEFV